MYQGVGGRVRGCNEMSLCRALVARCPTRGCSGPHPAVALGGILEIMRGEDAAAEPQGRCADDVVA